MEDGGEGGLEAVEGQCCPLEGEAAALGAEGGFDDEGRYYLGSRGFEMEMPAKAVATLVQVQCGMRATAGAIQILQI